MKSEFDEAAAHEKMQAESVWIVLFFRPRTRGLFDRGFGGVEPVLCKKWDDFG